MLRPSFLLRRTGSAWLLVSCLMVSVFVTATLVSALLTFYSDALPATVSQELASSGTQSVLITAQASGSLASLSRLVDARMHTAFGAVPYQQYQAVWSNDVALPGAQQSGNVPVLQAASLTGITSHATLTAGTWPTAPKAGQPVPVALPAAVAARLNLGVGSVRRLHYVGSHAGVQFRVAGLIRLRDPGSLYWRLSPLGQSGVVVSGGFASYGPAVVSPAALVSGSGPAALQPNDTSFVFLPRLARISPAGLQELAARLDAASAAVQSGGGAEVSTALPQTLLNVARSLAAARSLVVISGLQLLLLAGAALALAGRLLASQRDEETALLSARGAARWQLVRPSLTEGMLACAVAAVAGAVAGVRLSALLLTSVLARRAPAPALGAQAWLGAGFVLLLCLGIVLWPSLRPAGIAAVRVRRGRQATVASVAPAGADVALIALALVSVHELLRYSAAAGGAGIDPVIVIAPALALAGLALIPLRLLPLAARGLERVTARGRRLGAALANWEISRRPVRQSGPALLVILAVATSTLALAQYQSWQQSVHDQAAFATGARIRVGLATPEPLSGVTSITRLRGVTAAMPVSQQPLGAGQLLAVSAPEAGATVTMRPDLSARVPVEKLWSDLDQRQGATPGLAVPGRPERIAVTASMAGGLAGQLGPVFATVTVQDAYGLAYQLPAGSMPADGRPHELVALLGASAGIAYPVRLLGVALSYSMPFAPTSARARAADAAAVVTFASVAASPAATGPLGAPFAAGRELAGWRPRTSAPGLDRITGSVLQGQADGSRRPSVVSWGAAGQDADLKLSPGQGPVLPAGTLAKGGVTSLPAQLQIAIPAPGLGVPLAATSAFLHANDLSTGSQVPISVGGTSVVAYVRVAVSAFPSVPSGGAVVANQATLQDALISAGGSPLPAMSWWLSTASGRPPAGLPPGASVADAAAFARTLEHDPVSAAPVKAALAVAVAAAILAALGFCVSVAASARARRGQRALLAALGVPSGHQARLFCLEEIMISGPAALVGLGLGVGLAHILIPAITLTATAGLPVPPVLVRVPVAWVAVVVLAVAAIPVLAAVITALRQPDPAAELRASEAAG